MGVEYLPADTKLRLLRDNILVRPLEWQPSDFIVCVRFGRALRGEVVAVGPGARGKRYLKDRAGNRAGYQETRAFTPCELKPGDVVELGGLNVFDGKGYSFSEIVIGTETLLMCQEADVALVREEGGDGDQSAA